MKTKIAKRLKRERQARGLNQVKAGKLVGLSKNSIVKIENEHAVGDDTITKICKAFNWTDGPFAEYYYGIPKEESNLILSKAHAHMEKMNVKHIGHMMEAIGSSMHMYRVWSNELTPRGKRLFLKFTQMSALDIRTAIEQTKERKRIQNKKEAERLSPYNPLDGETLKRWRTERGWTQYELAKKIGGHSTNVSQWERGVTNVPRHRVRELYELFDVPYEEAPQIKHKSEAQRKKEHLQRKELLHKMDVLYDGKLSLAPEDCKYLNAYRELVGA